MHSHGGHHDGESHGHSMEGHEEMNATMEHHEEHHGHDEEKEQEDAFLKRLVKHANASSALPSKVGRKKKVDITVVRKELDSKGHEKLKSETIQYKVDLSDVSKAKNTEKPGAQLLALKKTLQDKILEKKKREWEAKKQQIADENEEGT